MISDVQLALFVNALGVLLFVMVVGYHYIKVNAKALGRTSANKETCLRGVMLSSRILSGTSRLGASSQSRSICHKSKLKPKANNYHWPYDRRSYGFPNFWMDINTFGKFDENTKVIQVEGNISSGKQEFAKQLAEELGMLYLPQPELEAYYINEHGFDYRALNPLLPERLRMCDFEMFHECPSRHSVIHMQFYLYKLRLFQYLRALRHIFNTGQGVVLTRTVFTDRAIVEAMHNVGWLPMGHLRDDGVRFYDWKQRYIFIRNISLTSLQRPHLCIYLDTPVDVCLENIQNDSDPMIANSKAHTREFLEEIETAFKDIVLPKQEHNMQVVVVPHEKPKTRDEILDVIDDLEPLNFEYHHNDTRFLEWNHKSAAHYYFDQRRIYTTRIGLIKANNNCDTAWFDIAGLGDSITQGDLQLREMVYESNVKEGLYTEFETDPRVHGPLRQLFGKWKNYGERCKRLERPDFK